MSAVQLTNADAMRPMQISTSAPNVTAAASTFKTDQTGETGQTGDFQIGYETAGLALHQLVEAQAALTPEAIAVVHHTGETLTYAALNQRANQLAHYLVGLGVKAEQLIGLSLTRSPNMLVAFLGVLKAGAAYVPIDPNYPESRRQYILDDAKVDITLTESALLEAVLPESGSQTGSEKGQMICLDTAAETLAAQPTENLDIAIAPKQLAYVIYTSGSTGNPKGVMAHHLGLVNYSLALAEATDLTHGDRMLQFSTMSFDFIVSEVYPTLAVGGAVVLRSDDMVTSTKAFLDFITETEVSVIQFTTAFWHELVSGIDRLGVKLPSTLRLVLFGGEKASLALCKQWVEKVGPSPRLFNAYGPTEATVITTLYDANAENYDGSFDLPIGRAVRNAQTYVLDENLQPVEPGDAGELHIGGPGVTLGYMNLPEKTAKVFIDSPFEKGEKLYKTGDLVKMDESGLIEFVGRVDFQVKIRGFRIELGEIESCLDQYEKIEYRIVIAREDTPGDKRLVAYVVMKDGEDLDRADLKAFMQAQLPAFMMPSAIVVMDELPKNANGKIDRKALPAPAQADTQRTLISARTPLEEKLVSLWQSVLGIEPVGITDDFFELGGNSLLVMRLFSELEASFEQRLPLVEIFAAPTIEKMAERLAEITANGATAYATDDALVPLRTAKGPDEKPPLFLVHDVEGDTTLYLNLARQLESGAGSVEGDVKGGGTENDRAIYAIKPLRIFRGENAPLAHTRVPELAAHCAENIRRVQPHGPYLIGGLCAGGVIAYETACQLEQAGETVKLTLMDAPAPGAAQKEGLVANQRMENLSNVWASQKSPLEIAGKLWRKATNTLRYEITDRAERFGACAKAHTFQWLQDNQWPIPQVLHSLSARDLVLFAYHTYQPAEQSFSGDVLLIRATQGDGSKADTAYVHEYEDDVFGWGPYVQQSIQVRNVPGGHSSMLNATNAPAFVAALEPFIESE
ncbi:MAG: amino acid adenylation domain-containing protein [Phormidesmis sp.]